METRPLREDPPQPLIDLLGRLKLASPTDVRSVYRRVRGLARELPLFESAWVDALAQARLLTPYQASEINAGRGESLALGPYLLCAPLRDVGYAKTFLARQRDGDELVRLFVIQADRDGADALVRRLEALVRDGQTLDCDGVLPLVDSGREGYRIWAACRYVEGESAAEWMVRNGRFPPRVALEIARQVAASLAVLEHHELLHADLAAGQLILTPRGQVLLHAPGLRTAVRPAEGYAATDLPPEAYDYLAPERIAQGTPTTSASECFAVGCLGWHLLTGRPPLPGGTPSAKMRSSQSARIPDVLKLAPDTPPALAELVTTCLQRDPARRPESLAAISATLGSSTRPGRVALAACLSRSRRSRVRLATVARTAHGSRTAPMVAAAAAGCLLTLAMVTWPQWRGRVLNMGTNQPAAAVTEAGSLRTGTAVASSTLPANASSSPQRAAKDPDRPVERAAPRGSHAEAELVQPDRGVQRAAYHVVPRRPDESADGDYLLPTGGPLAFETLPLRAHQTVRGRDGQRPQLHVPADGLLVDVEGVRFVNVDFVRRRQPSTDAPPALVRLRGSRAEFHGCAFINEDDALAVGIRWEPPATSPDEFALPSSNLQLGDSLFRGVSAAVDWRGEGAVLVEAANVLHLGPGALVRLSRGLRLDEPLVLSLAHCTLRGGALVEARYRRVEDRPGEISIATTDCAFVPADDDALLTFVGDASPEHLLRFLRWSGQGSVLAPRVALAAWIRPSGATSTAATTTTLDDSKIDVAGLVHSELEFAGPPSDNPATSRVIRWQVPLRSTDPPGIGEWNWTGTVSNRNVP